MPRPIEVPWHQLAGDLTCIQCSVLLDNPSVKLTRTLRLNGARDGWVIAEFWCQECGWNPTPLTASIEEPRTNGRAPAIEAHLVIPSQEEVETYTAPEPVVRSRIITPEPKPVELAELYNHIDKKFPLFIEVDGKDLRRRIAKIEMPGLGEDDPTGGSYVKVEYTDGTGPEGAGGFDYAKILYFCTNGLPDASNVQKFFADRIRASKKLLTEGIRHVPPPKPERDRGGSNLSSACSICGDRTGSCDCPGKLKRTTMTPKAAPPRNLLVDTDGRPITPLYQEAQQEGWGERTGE